MGNNRQSNPRSVLAKLLTALMITSLIMSMVPVAAMAAAATNMDSISSTVPGTMVAGQSYTVRISVKNTGTATWTAKSVYRLVAVGGSDPLASATVYSLASADSIKANATKTFTITMTAPLKAGKFTTDWQMYKGTSKFGSVFTKNVTVTMAAKNNQVVSASAPAKVDEEKSSIISVTFKNTGSSKWTQAGGYQATASIVFEGVSIPFEISMLNPADSVATGGTKTFSIPIDPLYTDGTFTFTVQMSCGNSNFGAMASKSITFYLTDAEKLEYAKEDVAAAEDSLSQDDHDYAQNEVNALPAGAVKTALSARLDAVQDAINALNQYASSLTAAKKAVEKCESTGKQTDLNAAQDLVNTLQASSYKTGLQSRINAEQTAIDNTAASKVKAEITALPAAGSLTLGSKAAVQAARADYNKLTTNQQALVTNLSTLATDEAAIASLEAAAALAVEQTAAHGALTTAYNNYLQSRANYSDTNWGVLDAAKTTGDTAIDAQTSIADVDAARDTALAAMTAVLPDAE